MKLRTLSIITAAAIATISCKKDKDTPITPSLDGYLTIYGLEEFVTPGQTCTLKVKGGSHPEGEKLGYYWKTLPSYPKADTLDITENYYITFTDTLQTCTIYCNAFAAGYSGLSTMRYATVVEGGKNGSIQGKGIVFPDPERPDEVTEKTIGSQVWTANNLTIEQGKSLPFNNCKAMTDVVGLYYNQSDAASACAALPGGNWTLPTREDWNTLITHVKGNLSSDYGMSVTAALAADATFNGTTMWKFWPEVNDIMNGSGFSAIPAGYANITAKSFDGWCSYAAFWTADKAEDNSNLGYCTYIYWNQPEVFSNTMDAESFGASVRCIKR